MISDDILEAEEEALPSMQMKVFRDQLNELDELRQTRDSQAEG
jgi:hypothetical protein